jgi:hypothetical protein
MAIWIWTAGCWLRAQSSSRVPVVVVVETKSKRTHETALQCSESGEKARTTAANLDVLQDLKMLARILEAELLAHFLHLTIEVEHVSVREQEGRQAGKGKKGRQDKREDERKPRRGQYQYARSPIRLHIDSLVGLVLKEHLAHRHRLRFYHQHPHQQTHLDRLGSLHALRLVLCLVLRKRISQRRVDAYRQQQARPLSKSMWFA